MGCPPHSIGEVYCPNCKRQTAFGLIHIHQATEVFYDADKGGFTYKPAEGRFKAIAECQKCRDTILIEFSFPKGTMVFGYKVKEPFSFLLGNVDSGTLEEIVSGTADIAHIVSRGLNLREFTTIDKIYPEDISPSCPEYVPEDVCNYFIEAQELLLNCDSRRFALVAFRLTVEAAIRHILEGEKGSLRDLIRKASKDGVIPGILADLADTIRALGNVGAHPEELEPFIGEIEEVYEFTRLFLELAFTYPERIRRLREKLITS